MDGRRGVGYFRFGGSTNEVFASRMLRIGYLPFRAHRPECVAALTALGCHAVRAEDRDGSTLALQAVLEFLTSGDELIVLKLEHLGPGVGSALATLKRLQQSKADLTLAEPQICTRQVGYGSLIAVLAAAAPLEAAQPRVRSRRNRDEEIRQMTAAGFRPGEIARHLGVSRMTVWRALNGSGETTVVGAPDAPGPE